MEVRRFRHEFRWQERSARRSVNRNRCYERNIEDQKGPSHRSDFALLILTRFEFL